MGELSDYEKAVLRKLDILIALVLDTAPAETLPMRARIRRLADLGLAPAEVGRIIGRPANYVTAMLGPKKQK